MNCFGLGELVMMLVLLGIMHWGVMLKLGVMGKKNWLENW